MKLKIPLPTITNCDDCGACCTDQAALPIALINSASGMRPVRSLPPALRDELAALVADYMSGKQEWPADDSPCIWYDPLLKQCKHYEHRPDICRDSVKPGDDACRKWRRQRGVDKVTTFVIKGGRLCRA